MLPFSEVVHKLKNVHVFHKIFWNFKRCSRFLNIFSILEKYSCFQILFTIWKNVMFSKFVHKFKTMFEDFKMKLHFKKLFGISKNVPVFKICAAIFFSRISVFSKKLKYCSRFQKIFALYVFFKYVQIWIKDPTKNPFATVSGHLLWMTSLQWTFTLCWTRSLQWTDTLQCIIGYLRRPNRERASVFARLLDATSEGQTEAPGLPEYVVLPLPQNVRPFLTLQRK